MKDQRYLALAEHVSGWSKDPSTKVGAVIVDDLGRVRSLGYNGFPRRIADTPERLNNREEKYTLVVHAEINAILNAGGSVEGCTLYTWPLPCCDRCAGAVIQAGVKRVVWPDLELPDRWRPAVDRALAMFQEAGVNHRQVP